MLEKQRVIFVSKKAYSGTFWEKRARQKTCYICYIFWYDIKLYIHVATCKFFVHASNPYLVITLRRVTLSLITAFPDDNNNIKYRHLSPLRLNKPSWSASNKCLHFIVLWNCDTNTCLPSRPLYIPWCLWSYILQDHNYFLPACSIR